MPLRCFLAVAMITAVVAGWDDDDDWSTTRRRGWTTSATRRRRSANGCAHCLEKCGVPCEDHQADQCNFDEHRRKCIYTSRGLNPAAIIVPVVALILICRWYSKRRQARQNAAQVIPQAGTQQMVAMQPGQQMVMQPGQQIMQPTVAVAVPVQQK